MLGHRPSEIVMDSITSNRIQMKNSNLKIGTWNVRGLNKPGKLENVLQEMCRMELDILGIAETFWDGSDVFETTLSHPTSKYKVLYSGGDKKRKGVAVVSRGVAAEAIQSFQMVSERIICVKIRAKPVDLIVIQTYAPTSDAAQAEVDEFYHQIDDVVKTQKKYQDCLIVMGDFNSKVGDKKEDDIVGPYGLGLRNDNGQSLIECCQRHNLMISNTWFQTKIRSRHTWTAPDGKTKNQIDYILIDKRYRNGIRNSKARPGADCGSDHNPVVAYLRIKLQLHKKLAKDNAPRWNTEVLKDTTVRRQFEEMSEAMMANIDQQTKPTVNSLWSDIKTCIIDTAKQVCGLHVREKKQSWMTTEIIQKMEERRQYKSDTSPEGQKRYKELKHIVQRLCRQAENNYYNGKCKEIEFLEATHNPLLYKKIKELNPKRSKGTQGIKDKDGHLLQEPQEILQRWAEYVEELYNDNRSSFTDDIKTEERCSISEAEVQSVIQKLTRNKATGDDSIPAEFIQALGPNGIQLITKLMNKIYNTGVIPDDFLQNIFITIPKISNAQDCSDFRTISLISHVSKILLHLINARITPIIERHLTDSQLGFRKGKGTKDAIFQFRTVMERVTQVNKKVYACFIDYQKAFDRINHEKLLVIMEKAGIPDLERKLIKSLYWNQYAVIRTKDGKSRKICIRRGVRQGCIISPILFNLYSEYMMQEIHEKRKGIEIGGRIYNNLRYADDAVVMTDNEADLQDLVSTVNDVCKDYGMAMNVKKTKTMVINKSRDTQCSVMVDGNILEQVSQYKYLGSWVTEDGRCDLDVKTRIGMAKDAFWKHKQLLKGNINLQVKKRILQCYVFPVVKYSCESWTLNKDLSRRINALEQWCYRRLLKIKWIDKISNEEVLRRMNMEDMSLYNSIKKQKLSFAGHLLRGSAGESALQILEGRMNSKVAQGRPRRMWIDDVKCWMNLDSYESVKSTAQDRHLWRTCVHTACQPSASEDDS